jgi:molybdate transport system regulatory protein
VSDQLIDPNKIRIRVNVWLENEKGEVLFGSGRHQILEAVKENGTLAAAATALGMSYRGLWGRIRISEKRLGFGLLDSHAGRGPESGSTLTTHGEALMRVYAQIRGAVRSYAREKYAAMLEQSGNETGPTC